MSKKDAGHNPLPEAPAPSTAYSRPSWAAWATLGAIVLLYLLVRVPLLFRQAAGQDEDYYAVPGWTIVQEGIPKIPYLPARDRQSVFYRADEGLFALPPAFFYLQGGVMVLLGPGIGPARLTSALAGVGISWVLFYLGRVFYGESRPALWGIAVYTFSRVFFFPATFARPDLWCAFWGLLALAVMSRWHETRSWKALSGAGALAGLALLTHPFALVVCLQLGGWVLLAPSAWRQRAGSLLMVAGSALAVLTLWVPLIWSAPELFIIQFGNNVLGTAGPGLLGRILWPWPSFRAQSSLFLEHAGVVQTVLLAVGLVGATILDCRSARPGHRLALACAWSSVGLLMVCQGAHVAKGYWCYPGAYCCLCLGRCLVVGSDILQAKFGRWAVLLPVVALGLILLPGSGLRGTWVHLRHWRDDDYSHGPFAAKLIKAVPNDGPCLVDVGYILDFYLAGRAPVLALAIPRYFDARATPYRYLVVSRTGVEQNLPHQLQATRRLYTMGNRQNPFTGYAEIWIKE